MRENERLQIAFEKALGGQGAGLAEIGLEFQGTSDERVCNFLAKLVLDEARSREVRIYAYLVLIMVCGHDIWRQPDMRGFKIPADFDMALLEQCLAEPKGNKE
jgi:hypothetical protein